MTPLFIILTLLGLTDLATSASNMGRNVRRLTAAATGVGAGASITWLSGYDLGWWGHALAGLGYGLVAVCWVLACDWALLAAALVSNQRNSVSSPNRETDDNHVDKRAQHNHNLRGGPVRAIVVLWGLALGMVAVIASNDLWPGHHGGRLQRLVSDLPYGPAATDPAKLLAAVGGTLFLLESSNVVVRLVLQSTSVDSRQTLSPDRSIKGGRLIGPIERLLILGLAVAGEPTAAALIISAKGLLRYPEIGRGVTPTTSADSAKPAADPAALSEYLVVGSMVSWALALAVVALLPST